MVTRRRKAIVLILLTFAGWLAFAVLWCLILATGIELVDFILRVTAD